MNKKDRVFRYDIHHEEWEIKEVEIKKLEINYKIGEIHLINPPDKCHYSNGIQVISWKRVSL